MSASHLKNSTVPKHFADSPVVCSLETVAPNACESDEIESKAKQNAAAPRSPETGSKIAKHVLTKPDSAAAMWDEVFVKRTPSADQFADAIAFLHNKKEYNVAVEGMLSAIRNDQSAPWIYDVLALEMKLAGRPAKEISRVLESRIDFSTSDVKQLLITAALLSRIEAWDEAIDICREASEVNPEIPEVWLLGRSIADKSKQTDAQVFFRLGVLKHVWNSDFELHHKEARKAIEEICDTFDHSSQSDLGQEIREQMRAASSLDLKIDLKWVGPADLDLFITEPGGEKCSYKRKVTANGGRLVREEGIGKSGESRHTETYICQAAPSGEFEIAVRFVLGKAVAGTAVLEIIHHAGTPDEKRFSKTIQLSKDDTIVTTILEGGHGPQR